MRGRVVEIAELVLLATAFAVALLLVAAILLQYCRRRIGSKPPPELPLSRHDDSSPAATKQSCITFLPLMLCSGRHRRARVEPASANSTEASLGPAVEAEVEDMARWTSRALYTIHEEDEVCSTTEDDGTRNYEEKKLEPETPFYTPPASPPHLADQGDC